MSWSLLLLVAVAAHLAMSLSAICQEEERLQRCFEKPHLVGGLLRLRSLYFLVRTAGGPLTMCLPYLNQEPPVTPVLSVADLVAVF